MLPIASPAEGEDRTARRNIPVRGGTVIVSGPRNAVPGDTIRVGGDPVVVDGGGNFVVSRILPVGDSIVEVEAYGSQILRDVHVPASDWFRTGLIDVTRGFMPMAPCTAMDSTISTGVAAFYVSGITASGWRVTASADTEYGPLEDMFSRLDDRDPLRVLDRLREDGSDLYPTYGDDSTWYDDTPTSGNLYLRVQNETTRLTWGDFTSAVEGPGLMRSSRESLRGRPAPSQRGDDRGRRGASDCQRPCGATRQPAAAPISCGARAGRSIFLSRRELLGGSTRVTIEETDPDTGVRRGHANTGRGSRLPGRSPAGCPDPRRRLWPAGTSDGTVISGPSARAGPEPRGSVRIPAGG